MQPHQGQITDRKHAVVIRNATFSWDKNKSESSKTGKNMVNREAWGRGGGVQLTQDISMCALGWKLIDVVWHILLFHGEWYLTLEVMNMIIGVVEYILLLHITIFRVEG